LNQLDQCSADLVDFLFPDSIEKRRQRVFDAPFLPEIFVLVFRIELFGAVED